MAKSFTTIFGVLAAWAYSAEPVRLKRSGWWGPGLVGLCYEGLPWFTGAAVLAQGAPSFYVVTLAALYAFGAHGIMTLNDFKSVEGDRRMGIGSLPVRLGIDRAARVACWAMAVPQAIVVLALLAWDRPVQAGIVGLVLVAQLVLMRHFLQQPSARAIWYSGFGVLLYVMGMLASAFALRDDGMPTVGAGASPVSAITAMGSNP